VPVPDPVVTIIVPGHSVRPELERCFASIREHAEMPVATIYVDNASTDDSREWVRRVHPEVSVIPLPTNEGYAARDHALRRSTSPYTMFLDSDAALTAGALPAMVAAMEANPSWGLLSPRLVYDDGTLQRSCRRYPPLLLPLLRRPPFGRFFEDRPTVQRHLMGDFDHDRTRECLYTIGACHLFRTDLARRAGPFPQVFIGWDDTEWCFQIRDAGGKIVFFPDATVIHRYRRETKQKPFSRKAFQQVGGFIRFQRRYWRRRRELIELSEELDRRAGAGAPASARPSSVVD
jgi:GT2 family glycosyltransferase